MNAVPIDREALIQTLVAGLAADFRQHLLPSAIEPAAGPADAQPADAADPERLDDALRTLETLVRHFDDSPELAALLGCARRLRAEGITGSGTSTGTGSTAAARFHRTPPAGLAA
jgi:hypothetical protein